MQAGDSFASLARQYYGSERHAADLLKANPHVKDPARLAIGTVITIPPQPAAGAGVAESKPANSSGEAAVPAVPPAGQRTYQVKPGDSFYAIARDVLGDANRWNEVFALNRDKVDGNPNRLRVGQVLVLPGT